MKVKKVSIIDKFKMEMAEKYKIKPEDVRCGNCQFYDVKLKKCVKFKFSMNEYGGCFGFALKRRESNDN